MARSLLRPILGLGISLATFIFLTLGVAGPSRSPNRRVRRSMISQIIESLLPYTFQIDVDEAEEVAMSYQVEAMPTFVAIKNGAMIQRFAGANKNKIGALVNEHCSK